MMKNTLLAVAVLMVGSMAVAGDEHTHSPKASCSSKVACVKSAMRKYGYEKPKAAVLAGANVVKSGANYTWNGKSADAGKVVTWTDRAVRITGLFGIIYHGVVPATSKAYAFISTQVKALKKARA